MHNFYLLILVIIIFMTKNHTNLSFSSFSAFNLRSRDICKAANFQARGPEKLQIDFAWPKTKSLHQLIPHDLCEAP